MFQGSFLDCRLMLFFVFLQYVLFECKTCYPQKKNVEVLFCYEAYDEVVLMQLREFDGKRIVSVEKEMRQDKDAVDFDGGKYNNV